MIEYFLAFNIMPMPFAIFVHTYLIWDIQFSLFLITTPKNFVSLTSMIRFPSISRTSISRENLFGVKSMKFVLSMFRDNSFAFTHEKIILISW